MKPRFEPRSADFDALLKEALELEEKLIEKAQPGYKEKEGATVGPEGFYTVAGGGKANVRNQGYQTNNTTIEVEDVKNKGAISENSDVTTRESPYYPTAFSTTGALENEAGGEGPVMKSVGGSVERIQVQDLKKSVDRLARRLE
jgi:hypothetical protein